MALDLAKIHAMIEWLFTDLWGILGLTGFYHKFIHVYAIVAGPLTTLLTRDAFQWSSEAQAAFEQLKVAMI